MPAPAKHVPALPRILAAAVTMGVALVLVPFHGGSAAAAVPAPPAGTFAAAIEAPASYEPQQQCDPVAKPGTLALRELLAATYHTTDFGIVRGCGVGAESEHKEGRALDWMISATRADQKALADGFLAWLLATDTHGSPFAMARRLGIQYMIWNRHIWASYRADEGWRAYSGPNPHTDHVHFSLSWDGAAGLTSYYSGRVVQRTFCANPPTPAAAARRTAQAALARAAVLGSDFVPLTAARILDTRSGAGMTAGPCRLGQSRRLNVVVRGHGGVPATGVVAVALNIAARDSNAPTYLSAFPAGSPERAVRVVSAVAGITGYATTVVPLGAGGAVSLTTLAGSTDVTVDVAGYYLAPELAGSRFHPMAPAVALVGPAGPAGASGTTAGVLPGAVRGVLPARGRRELRLGGLLGIPATGVRAAIVSVTVPAAKRPGAIAVYAKGGRVPGAAQVAVAGGRAGTYRVVTPTSADGTVVLENRSAAAVAAQVDVLGWYAGPGVAGGRRFVPVAPDPVLDTRTSVGAPGALVVGHAVSLQLTSTRRVPATGVAAVVLSVTALAPTDDAAVTVWSSLRHRPATRDLTLRRGVSATSMIVVQPGSDGRIQFASDAGTANLVAAVVGYYR